MSDTFEHQYEKSPYEMDEGEWRLVLLAQLKAINQRLDQTNGKVRAIPEQQKCIDRHTLYFKLLSIVATLIFIPLVVALFKLAFKL